MPEHTLPSTVQEFANHYPEVWKAFSELGNQCHSAGPLDEKNRRLVKIALSIGAGLEGATHSAVRGALRAGVSPDEIQHLAVLSITTLGFPAAMRAMTWLFDALESVENDATQS